MIAEGIYLGVDGGGTKTEVLAADQRGKILGKGIHGPSNPLFVGRKAALEAVVQAVRSAMQRTGSVAIRSVAVCVPGFPSEVTQADLSDALSLPDSIFEISGDDLSTFYGALGGSIGIVVLAGTGSFAMGIDSQGTSVSLGGWGPLLGDEGSGYAIGKDALRAVISAAEERGEPTLLTRLIFHHFSIHESVELRPRIYRSGSYQHEISSLTPLVLQAAQIGDEVARRIIRQAGQNLAEMAVWVARRMQFNPGEGQVALSGGVANLGEFLWTPFREQIHEEIGAGFPVKPARFSPAVGALLIAYRAGGQPLSASLLEQLDAGYCEHNLLSGDLTI